MLSITFFDNGRYSYCYFSSYCIDEESKLMSLMECEETGVTHYLKKSLNKAAIQQVMDDVRNGI